ncbi:malectin domain-containing carbohydrate-binding protein [Mucilaginibacter sp. CSA2-8R]|uniref:malectin domain-containing carbohydrate-binding protein n=1 Tax=Mucilaginibacter sp. CSA2-8R TaxID=3141542 RepID=UPI00315CFE23
MNVTYRFKPVSGFFILTLLQTMLMLSATIGFAQIRQDVLLNNGWHSIAHDQPNQYTGFEQPAYNDNSWKNVTVPHNWDIYEGYRRLKHGNRHGYAWYRKMFTAKPLPAGQRYFLWFEGVSSYATVWLNGKKVGYHAGGRTSFTLDVTDAVRTNKANVLAVRADHPANIQDLPWVCGGCSDEVGFSEGSQPMGIFRPVHLMAVSQVRVEPFGVHLWNDTTVSEKSANINLETEIKNYSSKAANIVVESKLLDAQGKTIVSATASRQLGQATTATIPQKFNLLGSVHLWSLQNPYLYRLQTRIFQNGKAIDEINTPYGIRWIKWPLTSKNGDGRFYLNGKPVFINGIGEYEHLMGRSHAFTSQEIKARVMQVRAAGFNAFRDAHQPHNLEYQQYWDKLGLLWWPQFSAHIWYNTPQFRENYKKLIVEWIKERRNSPSVTMWGLENESKLPEDFARECTELIRKLDPTASIQRPVTTCNGGKGTDWDVPQNWTGTYGGNPLTYADDLKKQILVGEYGAWRSLELHTEGPFVANGPVSEDRMTQLMETKVRLAEAAKNKVAGQYHWLLYSHENPGRIQGGEGYRELDRVGPINYKGLFTPWGQPLDVFYMFRANYADKHREPMAYIVSHTWPNRWVSPGVKDSITVYSNCDEVELFNDVKSASLGRQKSRGIGTHFQWDKVDIKYNVLYAVGYVNGKPVAQDYIVLNNLPQSPNYQQLFSNQRDLFKPATGQKYLYRVNCGGPEYTDSHGNVWRADVHRTKSNSWGSTSWTDDYKGIPAFFASQQRTFDAVCNTSDGKLLQTYRYGIEKLQYHFPVADGTYQIELYFNEPWYGTGGGMDCSGWRQFDVAINGKTFISRLDIWKEAGYNIGLKKVITATVKGGSLNISFPEVYSGQAIVSAIAISSSKGNSIVAPSSSGIINNITASKTVKAKTWLDIGDQAYADDSKTTFNKLPSSLYGAEWIQTANDPKSTGASQFNMAQDGDVYIAMDASAAERPNWLKDFEVTGLSLQLSAQAGHDMPLYRKRYRQGEQVSLKENKGSLMYLAIVLPANTLEPATDLRKTVTYKADDALAQGGAKTDTLSGRKVIHFGSSQSTAVFSISPGVADLYALRIKYYNFTSQPFTANMQLLAADGTVMKTEQLSFKPVQKGKSGTVATTTGTSVNAGNYRVVITAPAAEGLSIASIEMQ